MRTHTPLRARVHIAVLALCLLVSSATFAQSPGKLLYAKGSPSPWSSTISIAAPINTALTFSFPDCFVIGGPFGGPCDVTIPANGARAFDSEFFRDNFAGPDLGIIDVPAGVENARSFLQFDDGVTHTAFTAPILRDVLELPTDEFRAAVAASTESETTCVTAYADSDLTTSLEIVAYGPDGERARDADGLPVPATVARIAGRTVSQTCLSEPRFDAGSIRIRFGCAGIGPCPGPQPTWLLVTKGPLSGATIETLSLEKVTTP